jgi:hypothetical protein
MAALIGMAAILTTLLIGRLYPAVAGTADPTWPRGIVNVYDASGSLDTVIVAAHQWTVSGAHVQIRVVRYRRDADVVVVRDDKRLLRLCGKDCLGYTTAIGHPRNGHSEIILRSSLTGEPRPLSVWVAAHELGHVLGLQHRSGKKCSVMSPRAFDTRCAPSLGGDLPSQRDLACVPAPADVDVAASLYGGATKTRPPRCK